MKTISKARMVIRVISSYAVLCSATFLAIHAALTLTIPASIETWVYGVAQVIGQFTILWLLHTRKITIHVK